ncbi:ABC transporter permease [Nesterenkonia ebinurensis]|uniref:ABC transporter permease n=1 Tax=Nesterenkonia ebinurensis TaxID=2608252 RepID=UPI00123D0009|nr:ABC transporter permease [Nesterenkonia ebinurensis]
MSNEQTPEQTDAELEQQMVDLAEVEDAKLTAGQKSYSQGQLIRRRFFSHVPAMISLVVLTVITVMAFTSVGYGIIPGWWQHPFRLPQGAVLVNGGQPTMFTDGQIFGPHPFGQDSLPRDIFARVMRGTQQSLIIGVVVAFVSSVIGILIGAIAGYFRGKIESVLMTITDFVIVVPLLVIAAILGSTVSNMPFAPFPLAIMLGIVSWTGMARLVRAEVLSLREKEYVAAAIAMGASPWRIIGKHMLPNSIGVIIVNASFTVAAVILLESTLSYLGMGIRPPEVSLGLLVSEGESAINTRPHLFWIPGIFILVITLCVNFVGDGLRDAFDPRQQRKGDRRPGLRQVIGLRGFAMAQRRNEQIGADASSQPTGPHIVPGSNNPRTNQLQFWRKK